MKKEIAQKIVNSDQKFDLKLYENYSGRGMYGETTTGIVCGSVLEVAATALQAGADFAEQNNDIDATIEFLSDLAQEISDMRQDSLGREMIVY